jgi:alcohol dehydrogenase (cytochrome c)
MYLTTPSNHAFAIDVRTGRPLWHYERSLPKELSLCCGPQNRGFGALGDLLFLGTLDAHVVALDAKTGRVRWDVEAAKANEGYSFTGAPLVVKDKVITGVAGGEYGIRGFIDAYEATTGSGRGALPSRAKASRATTHGPAIRGSAAAPRRGSPARTTRR